MKIKNLVRTDFDVISPELKVSQVEHRLTGTRCLVVKKQDVFLGILTSSKAVSAGNSMVADCIDSSPRIDGECDIWEVGKIMSKYQHDTVPVFLEDCFVGIVSQDDILQSLTEYCESLEEGNKRNRNNTSAPSIRHLKRENEQYHNLVKTFNRYRESMEKVLKIKSDLLADVSHELRNPLHIILSYAKQGLKRVDNGNDESVFRYFSRIVDSGNKMLLLVNDLLDLSKLEAGKTNYEFSEHQLSKQVEAVLEEFNVLLESKKIEIEFKKPTFPDFVIMDKNRILQVIRNLISNAHKFSPDYSRIKIEITQEENALAVSITDWGCGIPKNKMSKVFKKYEQVKQSETINCGTGLGLSIAQRIVFDHKGKIFATQNPQGGSVFTFTLPLKTSSD